MFLINHPMFYFVTCFYLTDLIDVYLVMHLYAVIDETPEKPLRGWSQ